MAKRKCIWTESSEGWCGGIPDSPNGVHANAFEVLHEDTDTYEVSVFSVPIAGGNYVLLCRLYESSIEQAKSLAEVVMRAIDAGEFSGEGSR